MSTSPLPVVLRIRQLILPLPALAVSKVMVYSSSTATTSGTFSAKCDTYLIKNVHVILYATWLLGTYIGTYTIVFTYVDIMYAFSQYLQENTTNML